MKDEKEKLEIKKKPQNVRKEDFEKVAGGGDFLCVGGIAAPEGCGYSKELCK